MGQVASTGVDGAPFNLATIPGEVQRQASTLREVATLNYADFLKDILELNQILGSHTFTDPSGKRLVFAIKKGSDSSMLWKGTVRIGCVKVDSDTGKIESYRLLNIRQFLQVRRTILYQASASNGGGGGNSSSCDEASSEDAAPCGLTTSLILNKVDDLECQGGELDECCICMERRPEVILPCAHNYCLPCIEQWNVSNKTCPVCRETLESTEDSWVISEKPDSAEIAAELQKCLIGLADDQTPQPAPPPP